MNVMCSLTGETAARMVPEGNPLESLPAKDPFRRGDPHTFAIHPKRYGKQRKDTHKQSKNTKRLSSALLMDPIRGKECPCKRDDGA